MKRRFKLLVTLVILLAGLTACSGNGGNNVDKDSNESASKEKLVVALLPDESPSTVIKNNEPLKDYLEKKLNKEIELVVTTDYSSMIESMRKKHIDIGYFGPLSYVLLNNKMDDVYPFAAKLDQGKPSYHAVIIAGSNSVINSLQDIKGKTMAFGDTASTSSHLIPKEMLKTQANLESGKDYEEQFVGAHDAVAMAVQNGNADAGGLSKPILDSLIKEGIIDSSKVKEIQLSKAYPNYPWAMSSSLPKDLQEEIKEAFYDLDDPKILKVLDAEGFAPVEDKDYDVIRNMVDILGVDLEEMQK